ncbi:MAG: sugar phosphate isomerase/epimerase [Pseudomonadota bacterium]
MPQFSYQLYSSRKFGPATETLTMLASKGYGQVEGYGGLFRSSEDVSTLNVALDRTGLIMPTAHFGFESVRDTPAEVIDIANTLGIRAVFVPAIGQRDRDVAGWAQFGKDLAEAGKPLQDAGLTFGWHNHDYEFADLGGPETPLDLILAGSDGLKLEIDLAWIQIAGQDPAAWVRKYADRIAAAHLKDIAEPGIAVDEDGWADVGHGVMDWPALVAALNRSAVQTLVMEHDSPSDDARFAERALAAAKAMPWTLA